jgi:hypothetical protein
MVRAATTAGMARMPRVMANETRRRGDKRFIRGSFLLRGKHLTASGPLDGNHVTAGCDLVHTTALLTGEAPSVSTGPLWLVLGGATAV